MGSGVGRGRGSVGGGLEIEARNKKSGKIRKPRKSFGIFRSPSPAPPLTALLLINKDSILAQQQHPSPLPPSLPSFPHSFLGSLFLAGLNFFLGCCCCCSLSSSSIHSLTHLSFSLSSFLFFSPFPCPCSCFSLVFLVLVLVFLSFSFFSPIFYGVALRTIDSPMGYLLRPLPC